MHHAVLAVLHPAQIEVEIWRSDELEVRRGLSSELDEMWSFVQAKAHPRWLWHAIDHHTGQVLAYVFGRRKDSVFLRLQELLAPFGITKYYTDGWGAYERHLEAEQHHVGKEHTQKIESKHINQEIPRSLLRGYLAKGRGGRNRGVSPTRPFRLIPRSLLRGGFNCLARKARKSNGYTNRLFWYYLR